MISGKILGLKFMSRIATTIVKIIKAESNDPAY
jgi:hypothetical protein